MATQVVIIDSGVNMQHPRFKTLSIVNQFNAIDGSSDIQDRVGHGTAVANIIHTICDSAELTIVKIYDQDLSADLSTLFSALRYVYDNIECDILHLSLGVGYFNCELLELCQMISSKGTLLVSAFDNGGSISYPAAFDFVIGVESSSQCRKSTDFLIPKDEIVSVYAKGGFHRVAWTTPEYTIQQGNSMSAAYVTGYLSKEHQYPMNKADALKILDQISTYTPICASSSNIKEPVICTDEFCSLLRDVKNVALFPFNKEITSLINYANYLPFRIQGLYTCRHLGNIGKKVEGIFGGRSYEIQNIDNIDFSDIDMMVIGHLTDLENLAKTNYKQILLERCLANNVNVYSFDAFGLNNFPERFYSQGRFLYAPQATCLKTKKRKGKLYQIASPVVGVFGTSSKQGKYTLQLHLRNLFLEWGYQIAQLGTEPTAPLFGLEECLTFGYNSALNYQENEFIHYVNEIMNRLDRRSPDMILVGSQSGTVPAGYCHLGQMTIKQLEFLIAINPDTVILCVNPSDEFYYIRRTIETIRHLADTNILAIAIYPFYFENGWRYATNQSKKLTGEQIDQLKERYRQAFGIDSYEIGNKQEMSILAESILAYFSEETDS